MGGIKDEALKQICDDYKLKGHKSFIYKYIWANEEKLRKKCEGLPKKEQEKLINKRVRNFIYDLTTRSNNTALNMIDSWYSLQTRKKGNSHGAMDLKQYQKLFDKLQADPDSESIVIPIRVDYKTGAGVYILGKKNYLEGHFKYSSNYHCGLEIISKWDNTGEYGIALHCDFENEDLEHLGPCISVEEAVKFFDACSTYQEENLKITEVELEETRREFFR